MTTGRISQLSGHDAHIKLPTSCLSWAPEVGATAMRGCVGEIMLLGYEKIVGSNSEVYSSSRGIYPIFRRA